jgi:hypothetical protein
MFLVIAVMFLPFRFPLSVFPLSIFEFLLNARPIGGDAADFEPMLGERSVS